MKHLIAIVFLLATQGTSVLSLRGSARVFFNKAYTNAKRTLAGIRSSSGDVGEGGSMMVRNIQLINHFFNSGWCDALMSHAVLFYFVLSGNGHCHC